MFYLDMLIQCVIHFLSGALVECVMYLVPEWYTGLQTFDWYMLVVVLSGCVGGDLLHHIWMCFCSMLHTFYLCCGEYVTHLLSRCIGAPAIHDGAVCYTHSI